MGKRIILLIAALAVSVGSMAAAKAKVLYNSKKPSMYQYAFPEGGSTIAEKTKGDRAWMAISLKGDAWAGCGIGVDKQRLGKYLKDGALQFYMRSAKKGESFDVGFVMAKGLNPEDLAYQILAPVGNFAKVSKKWTKVVIPLADFPKDGTRWIEHESRNAKGKFNWNRVSEFVISRAPGGADNAKIELSDIMIIPAYDKGAAKKAASAATAVSGDIVMFNGKAFSDEGGGSYTYPDGESSGVVKGAGMEVKLKGTAWSGGGIFRAPINIASYKAKGMLEIQLKGKAGKEVIYTGLVDKTNGASVRLSINPYLPGGMKAGEWKTVQIPLADFPAMAAKWDSSLNKNVTFEFDWTKVTEVLFDNNGPGNNNNEFMIGKIVIREK